MTEDSVYQFTVKDNKGEEVKLSKYEGTVLLIVNTATKCGKTKQYSQLQSMYEKFSSKKFEILDFPCNQFGGQAPGSDDDIEKFCTTNYNTTFPRFAKVNVKGKDIEPLFAWLIKQKPGKKGNTISWNFEKFLINKEGKVVERFLSPTEPNSFEETVEKYL